MSVGDKAIILTQVENKSGGKRQALMALWQLLSVASGTTRFGKLEKTMEPNHSGRRRQDTGDSPGVSRSQQSAALSLDQR